ncbi:MAG: GAF domain-containing sensor histidine kinase [Bacteroidales bacterium]|nr:GAF domain-containing sensor histidine kinase [Bacteroidales bacterium]
MQKRQKDFYRIMSHLLHSENLNFGINQILQEAMEKLGGDRAYIFSYDHGQKVQNCIYEVVSESGLAEIEQLQGVPFDATPWWNREMISDRAIYMHKLEELPPEAKSEYEILDAQNIKSILVEPLIINGKTWGYVGIDFVKGYDLLDNIAIEWFTSVAGMMSLSIQLRQSQESERVEREQLKAAKEKAEELNMLVSSFIANVNHEIRTPLNSIISFSELLIETEDYQERKEFYSIVKRNSDWLTKIVSDLLNLSKIESGAMEYKESPTDINALCQDIVFFSKLKHKSDVEIHFEKTLDTCIINTDVQRVQQVISNLMNNAMKFTKSGEIRLGYETLPSNHLRIYVKDTGIGIEEKDKERIFNRLVKLNNNISGWGLGLHICRGIVEELGGKIGVESECGKGSCFWFTLPLK